MEYNVLVKMKKIFTLIIAVFLVSSTFGGDFKVIPLPYAYFAGDEFKLGLFLTVPNIFRKNSSVTLNGLYSNSTKNAGVAINFPAVDARRPGFQTKFSFGQYDNQYSIYDYDNSSYYFFKKNGFEIEQSALGKFIYGKLETKLSTGYMHYDFDSLDIYILGFGTLTLNRDAVKYLFEEKYISEDEESGSEELLKKQHLVYISIGSKYTFHTSNLLFKSEKSILTKISYGFQNNFKPVFSFSGQLKIQHPIIEEWLRFDGNVAGYMQTTSNIFLSQTGADVGLTILNPKYVFKNVFGASCGIEFSPLKVSFGVLSIYTSYQFALYSDSSDNFYPNHGIIFGARAYNADSPTPIGSASISYNATKEKFYVHAGMAFNL